MEGDIRYQEIIEFIEAGLQTWEEVKSSFFEDKEMTAFLKKTYPVVCLDHHQIYPKLALTLYTSLSPPQDCLDESVRKELERKEAFRLKMVSYLESRAKSVMVEIRFDSLKSDLIKRIKHNPIIRRFNPSGKESINVIVAMKEKRK